MNKLYYELEKIDDYECFWLNDLYFSRVIDKFQINNMIDINVINQRILILSYD